MQSLWMSLLICRRCSKERSSSHYFLNCCHPSYQHQFIKIDQHSSTATASSPPTQPNTGIILIGIQGVTPCQVVILVRSSVRDCRGVCSFEWRRRRHASCVVYRVAIVAKRAKGPAGHFTFITMKGVTPYAVVTLCCSPFVTTCAVVILMAA